VDVARRYKSLKTVAKTNRGKISFVWLEGGQQPELEQALGLGFGFPAVVLVNTQKKRFATMKTAFDEKGIQVGGTRPRPAPHGCGCLSAALPQRACHEPRI
jgi:hypothetical protein